MEAVSSSKLVVEPGKTSIIASNDTMGRMAAERVIQRKLPESRRTRW